MIAFQIAWKLFHSRWNLSREPSRLPRILHRVALELRSTNRIAQQLEGLRDPCHLAAQRARNIGMVLSRFGSIRLLQLERGGVTSHTEDGEWAIRRRRSRAPWAESSSRETAR